MLYEELGLKFEYYNSNPIDDNRKHNDCVINAFSKLLNKSWDEVYDGLCEIGRKDKSMINSNQVILDYANHNDLDYCDDFVDDCTMFVAEFLSKIKDKNIECIASNQYHAFYFKDNTIYDVVNIDDNGNIAKSSRLTIDSNICDLLSFYIASEEDSEKILEIIENN